MNLDGELLVQSSTNFPFCLDSFQSLVEFWRFAPMLLEIILGVMRSPFLLNDILVSVASLLWPTVSQNSCKDFVCIEKGPAHTGVIYNTCIKRKDKQRESLCRQRTDANMINVKKWKN